MLDGIGLAWIYLRTLLPLAVLITPQTPDIHHWSSEWEQTRRLAPQLHIEQLRTIKFTCWMDWMDGWLGLAWIYLRTLLPLEHLAVLINTYVHWIWGATRVVEATRTKKQLLRLHDLIVPPWFLFMANVMTIIIIWITVFVKARFWTLAIFSREGY